MLELVEHLLKQIRQLELEVEHLAAQLERERELNQAE